MPENLIHWRVSPSSTRYPHSKPVIILTGGEPLMRDDIFRIAAYGRDKGLRMVMATNGTLVTEALASEMRATGIMRVS